MDVEYNVWTVNSNLADRAERLRKATKESNVFIKNTVNTYYNFSKIQEDIPYESGEGALPAQKHPETRVLAWPVVSYFSSARDVVVWHVTATGEIVLVFISWIWFNVKAGGG